MTAFEIGGNYRSVLLLTSSVPNIQFYGLLLDGNIFYFEVNCRYLRLFLCEELAFGKAPEESCFADVAITYYYHLVSLFVFVGGKISLLIHMYTITV